MGVFEAVMEEHQCKSGDSRKQVGDEIEHHLGEIYEKFDSDGL